VGKRLSTLFYRIDLAQYTSAADTNGSGDQLEWWEKKDMRKMKESFPTDTFGVYTDGDALIAADAVNRYNRNLLETGENSPVPEGRKKRNSSRSHRADHRSQAIERAFDDQGTGSRQTRPMQRSR